jgi:hypothetical protein
METNKIIRIILPLSPQTTNENNTRTIDISQPPKNKKTEKQIEKSPDKKRQITFDKTKWTFSPTDLLPIHQQHHLFDKSKQPFIYQQIKNKLSSYRCQDIDKKIHKIENQMDLSGVLHKFEESNLLCFYCKEIVFILYDNVRDPRQWTLERLDNKKGHVFDNVVIACLSCNLRRRTMKYERYVLTKEIKTVVKKESIC